MLLVIGAQWHVLYVRDVDADHVTTALKGYTHVMVSLASVLVTINILHVYLCVLI